MTSTPPGNSSKEWVSHGFKKRLQPRDVRPHAACPFCFLDATSEDTCTMLTFRCPRGHEFLQTRSAATDHGTWLARYHAGSGQA